jgi:hypothetical protein
MILARRQPKIGTVDVALCPGFVAAPSMRSRITHTYGRLQYRKHSTIAELAKRAPLAHPIARAIRLKVGTATSQTTWRYPLCWQHASPPWLWLRRGSARSRPVPTFNPAKSDGSISPPRHHRLADLQMLPARPNHIGAKCSRPSTSR